MPKISKTFIDKLHLPTAGLGPKTNKIPDSDTFYRDDSLRGFGVKQTKGGRIVFFAEGRVRGGKTKRITIGEYPFIGLEYARQKATEALSEMHKGIDPVVAAKNRKAQKASEEAREASMSITLQQIVDMYFEHRRIKPRTIRDYNQSLNRWFSDWLNEPITKITRHMVEVRFGEIQQNSILQTEKFAEHKGKASASKAMRILSAMCSYAMAHEVSEGIYLLDRNPVKVLSDKRVDRTLNPRKTHIPLNDVPRYLQQVRELCPPVVADLISLLLFTGLRLNEATKLQWNDVDMDNKLFTVRDTKNRNTLTHPMSEQVYEIFQRRLDAKICNWVFPSTKSRSGSLHPKHITDFRKSLKPVIEETNIDVSPHDLRRTFSTAASACGLDYLTLKRLMNHKHSDITERYVITASEQLRNPMQLVANKLQSKA